jgi:methionine-S-sulfoxide reductase
MLKGVKEVVSGYAGAKGPQPTYESVLSGRTGFAEAVEVQYDPSVISPENLLRVFFVSHDPTQLNRQGPDVGTQYRSAIFFRNEAEKKRAEKILAEVSGEKLFPNKIATTIEPLIRFWRAEEYHQDYFAKFEKASDADRAKMNAGYCSYVVSPKIEAFKLKFAHLLK